MVNIELCKEQNCNDAQIVAGYCRLHYIKNWRQLKTKEAKVHDLTLDDYLKQVLAPQLHQQELERHAGQHQEAWTTADSGRSQVSTDLEDIFSNEEELDSFLDEVTLAEDD
ncbi:MAG: hypothetical protein A2284_04960 [Deltaproteobacteria bacterium RIFOXYA12_FULL_61_11]|nr:MAG: hypothetical protein A2284_04960 [Deltaproteobacteria bacterium RIFOXYA12_FULL_61_11]